MFVKFYIIMYILKNIHLFIINIIFIRIILIIWYLCCKNKTLLQLFQRMKKIIYYH